MQNSRKGNFEEFQIHLLIIRESLPSHYTYPWAQAYKAGPKCRQFAADRTSVTKISEKRVVLEFGRISIV